MFIIFGILASIAVLLEEYFLANIFNFTVMGFSVFRFIPIGGLAIGAAIGASMSKGFRLSNKKLKAKGVLLCVLFGAITFVGINYMEYKTTYVLEGASGEYTMNRNFEGSPISEFVYDKNGQEIEMTFINYVKYNLDENDMTYTRKYGGEVTVNSHGTMNYIIFFVNFLAVLIGAACGSKVFIPAHFCEECNRYHTEKEVFQVEPTEIGSILKDDNSIVDDKFELVNFINSHKKKIKKGIAYVGTLSYCKQCVDGKIIIKKISINGNQRKEDTNAEKTIDVERSFVESLLQN